MSRSSEDTSNQVPRDTPLQAPLDKRAVARILSEATLQDLLRSGSYVVSQLLQERNDLLDERARLTGESDNRNRMDYLTPPPRLLPYYTTSEGVVLRYHAGKTKWARQYPEDRRQFEVGTQTDEPDAAADTTLFDIESSSLTHSSVKTNKRRRTESNTEHVLVEHQSGDGE